MPQPPTKPKKPIVTPLFYVFAAIVLVPMILIGGLFIAREVEYYRIKVEISRIASDSGIKPLSIDCHDVELGAECYADYDRLSYEEQSKMLKASGYVIDESLLNETTPVITALNSKTNTYVSGSYYEGSTTTLSFRFN